MRSASAVGLSRFSARFIIKCSQSTIPPRHQTNMCHAQAGSTTTRPLRAFCHSKPLEERSIWSDSSLSASEHHPTLRCRAERMTTNGDVEDAKVQQEFKPARVQRRRSIGPTCVATPSLHDHLLGDRSVLRTSSNHSHKSYSSGSKRRSRHSVRKSQLSIKNHSYHSQDPDVVFVKHSENQVPAAMFAESLHLSLIANKHVPELVEDESDDGSSSAESFYEEKETVAVVEQKPSFTLKSSTSDIMRMVSALTQKMHLHLGNHGHHQDE